MKFLVVVSCLLAVALAKPDHLVAPAVAYHAAAPGSFGYQYSSHYTAPVTTYAAHSVFPYARSIVGHPAVYSAGVVAPVGHSVIAAPVAHSVVAAPVAHSVVAAPVAHSTVVSGLEKHQYHAQDSFGQAVYGHQEPFQAHNAVQDAAGNKIGSYSYVAPNGQVVATNYVADALGYRVNSNAVPVGPEVPAETPEVVAARAAHLQEVENVKHRSRRSPQYYAGSHIAPLAYTSPLSYSGYGYNPIVARAGLSHYVRSPYAYNAYRTYY